MANMPGSDQIRTNISENKGYILTGEQSQSHQQNISDLNAGVKNEKNHNRTRKSFRHSQKKVNYIININTGEKRKRARARNPYEDSGDEDDEVQDSDEEVTDDDNVKVKNKRNDKKKKRIQENQVESSESQIFHPGKKSSSHENEFLRKIIRRKLDSDSGGNDSDSDLDLLRPILKKRKDQPIIELTELQKLAKEKNVLLPNTASSSSAKSDIDNKVIEKKSEINVQDSDGNTALHLAIRNENDHMTRCLLENGADPNIFNKDGKTALMYAAERGNVQILKELLAKNAKLEDKDARGDTALSYAVIKGHAAAVNCLLAVKNQSDITQYVNLKNFHEMTPLIHSSKNGHLEISRCLVKNGANVNIVDSEGNTALLISLDSKNQEIAEYLIANGADPNIVDRSGNNALITAVFNDCTTVSSSLIRNKNVDIEQQNRKGQNALLLAAFKGNRQIFLEVMKKGAKVNISDHDGHTPLMLAIVKRHSEIALSLIEKVDNLDTQNAIGHSALLLAAYAGQQEVVNELLKKEAKVNIVDGDRDTPLTTAIIKGNTSIASMLIKKTENVNIQNSDGASPLLLAAFKGHLNLVEELLKKGAQVDIPDKDRDTALLMACQGNAASHMEIAKLLIKHKSNVNFRNSKGVTCLLRATYGRKIDLVEILVANGANVNIVNIQRQAPLHLAAENGDLEIVKIFFGEDPNSSAKNKAILNLKNKPNLEIRNSQTWTPLMLAAYKNKTDVVKYLIEKGADVNATEAIGDTALMLACQEGSKECVIALLNEGAKKEIYNNRGQDAIFRASSNKHAQILQILKSDGPIETTDLILYNKDCNLSILKKYVEESLKEFEMSEKTDALIDLCEQNKDVTTNVVTDLIEALRLSGRRDVSPLLEIARLALRNSAFHDALMNNLSEANKFFDIVIYHLGDQLIYSVEDHNGVTKTVAANHIVSLKILVNFFHTRIGAKFILERQETLSHHLSSSSRFQDGLSTLFLNLVISSMENSDKKHRRSCLKVAPFILDNINIPGAVSKALKAVGLLIDDSEIISSEERTILTAKVCLFKSEEWGEEIVKIAVSIVEILIESSNTDEPDSGMESHLEKLKELKDQFKQLMVLREVLRH